MTKKLNNEDWVDDISSLLAKESIELLLTQGENRGEGLGELLIINFIAKFVGMTVLTTLKSEPVEKKASNKDKCKFVMENYAGLKSEMQEAIAAGFAGAFESFTGKPVDYYCTIQPVPEPTSKSVN